MASDRDLVDMLDAVWASIAALGDTLDESEWKQPTECPGWTVQDNLVHLTALERFILGDPLPSGDVPDDLPHVKNDIGKANERWIESRRSVDRRRRVGRVPRRHRRRGSSSSGASTTPGSPPTPGRRWARAPSPTCCGFRIFDSWVHEQDMRRGLDRPGDLDSPAARQALDMMVGVLPVHRREEGGGLRRFHRRARAHRTAPHAPPRSEVVDGRARAVDPLPADPTVTLTLASDEFARLACGRSDPSEALVTGVVAIEGDVVLGGEIVRQLNYMF